MVALSARRGRLAWIGVLLLLACPGAAEAATRRVPEDFSTLGAALLASAPFDTVLASAGTYAERVHLPPGVTLRAAGAPGSAVIDAGGLGAAVEARALIPAARLEGFRLTGGAGVDDGGSTLGGDLCVVGGSLAVRDCVFDGGHAIFGGGTGASAANVSFAQCTWSGSTAEYGGGHFQAGGTLQLTGATFTGTSAGSGGAVYATGDAQVTVLGCGIDNSSSSGNGGGLHIDTSVATLSNLRVDRASAGGKGGGVEVSAGGQVIASFCVFVECASAQGGGAFHVSCDAAAPASSKWGRSAAVADCALLSMTHCDVLLARGAAPAAGAVTGAGVVHMSSSIVAGNESGLACLDPRATLDVGCSDLYQNGGADLSGGCLPIAAATNLAVDPRLCDLPGRDFGLCLNSALLAPGCGDDFWGAGALACAACDPTPARPVTWGQLKAHYRD